MEFHDLRLLVAAAEAKSFGGAARSLGVHTSTISRRVGRLEDELGLALFERDRVGVRLTPGGRAVMHQATRTLAELSSVERVGSQNGAGEVGEVRLGTCVSPLGELVQQLLTGWRKHHPKVRLALHEMSGQALVTSVAECRLDIGLIPSFMLTPELVRLPLFQVRFSAALPSDHTLVAKESITWSDLVNETILVQEWADHRAMGQLCTSLLGTRGRFQPHAASFQSILGLVGADFGVALVTSNSLETAPTGVTFRPINEPDAWLPMDLVWRPELEDAAVGRFIAHMRDEARSRRLL